MVDFILKALLRSKKTPVPSLEWAFFLKVRVLL
jgi:hypothetical protein